MNRTVRIYFNQPIDGIYASNLVQFIFGLDQIAVSDVGSDSKGFFAVLEIFDPEIVDEDLLQIGDTQYSVVSIDGAHDSAVVESEETKPSEEPEDKTPPQEDPEKEENFDSASPALKEDFYDQLSEIESEVASLSSETVWFPHFKRQLLHDSSLSYADKTNYAKLMALMNLLCKKLIAENGSLNNSLFMKIAKWVLRIVG